MSILEKINAARTAFFRANGYLPNVLCMNISDYRALCELGDAVWLKELRSKVVKRQGELEWKFEKIERNCNDRSEYRHQAQRSRV